ncbi:MAG: Hsp33 family molecular chaperone HslO [Bacillota bacterium]
MNKDYLIRGTSKDGGIRFFCCDTTVLTEKARSIHDCYPVAAAALGRMLTAGSMMGTMLKSEKDSLTLQINGKGPAGAVVVVSDFSGNVRGYIHNPHVETVLKENGKLDVGRIIGYDGMLTVVKDFGLKEPYIGQIPIVSGEIGDDLTVYFSNSEQIPTSVGLGVLVETDGSVSAAGGFIIQILPGIDESLIDEIEYRLARIRPVTEMIKNGLKPEDIIKEILGSIEINIHERKDIAYVCNCSHDRIVRALISIGEKDLTDIIENEGKAELTCHFCNKKYNFNKEELIEMLEEAKGKSK